MGEGLTTSENVMKTSETKIEITPEQKKANEQAQKARDARTLVSYEFEIDNITVEIMKVEQVLKLKLAERELKEALITHKANLKRFKELVKILRIRLRK